MVDLPPNVIDEINVEAYFLAENQLPYDTLCWMLAERKLCKELKMNLDDNIPREMVEPRAAQIYFSCCDYDVLCWLIAEHDIKEKHGID